SKLTLLSKLTSSTSWRVRCALNYKGIGYNTLPVNLQDLSDDNGRKMLQLNPASRVPVLIHGERVITESLAIIEYLEENFGGPHLLPSDSYDRARSRAIALHITSAIHPIQSSRVTKRVDDLMGARTGKEWAKYWMHRGLKELEGMVSRSAGKYCVGDSVSVADTCLPSIIYKGMTMGVDLAEFPTLTRVDKNLALLLSFEAARPGKKSDASKLNE
ncbi:hypothetical protein PENTCL1PPCAC_12731, partial [Pristionchus entomophagus]